jgi:signal transduction histidine kinase
VKRRSIRYRVLAGVVASQLLLAAGLVWMGIGFTRRQLRISFDSRLQGNAMSIAALVRYAEHGRGLVFDASRVRLPRRRRHPPYYRVLGPHGEVVANTFPAGAALPPAGPRERHWNFSIRHVPYRGLLLSHIAILDTEEHLHGPPVRLDAYFAAPTVGIAEDVAGVAVAIGAGSLILLLLTLLLAGWIIRRELEPLRTLAQQAGAISPHNWKFEPAPPESAPAELRPLVQALQRMLTRLHASHQQQRAFMGDAAHHLKTPVAILKSTLQTLLQRPREREEYVAAAQASLGDIERLEQLLQRMLRLARLEQWAEDEFPHPLPLAEVGASCQAALEQVEPLARARGVALRGRGLEYAGWSLRADPEDLELVWVNLLENAVQHSPPGSTVEIACDGAEGGVRVTVRDQGPGIPERDTQAVFQRFRRGDSSPAGGFGLGLAIARAIVQAYGGAIAVKPQAAPGATLQVVLPLAGRGLAGSLAPG